jgi:hypothetical protein
MQDEEPVSVCRAPSVTNESPKYAILAYAKEHFDATEDVVLVLRLLTLHEVVKHLSIKLNDARRDVAYLQLDMQR